MRKFKFNDLKDMVILTNEGARLGKISEINIDLSGKIESIAVKPASEEVAHMLPLDEDDKVLVPFNSVIAVKDYVVVDEKELKSGSMAEEINED